jgi:hypothetical protein
VQISDSTLRYHVVGFRTKLGGSSAGRFASEKKPVGIYLLASWVKVRELQVECKALSDSMDEFRGTVERLQLSEMSLQERVRYLEMDLVALKRKGEAQLATLKRKVEAELVTLKRNGKASVACLEQFLYDGLC